MSKLSPGAPGADASTEFQISFAPKVQTASVTEPGMSLPTATLSGGYNDARKVKAGQMSVCPTSIGGPYK